MVFGISGLKFWAKCSIHVIVPFAGFALHSKANDPVVRSNVHRILGTIEITKWANSNKTVRSDYHLLFSYFDEMRRWCSNFCHLLFKSLGSTTLHQRLVIEFSNMFFKQADESWWIDTTLHWVCPAPLNCTNEELRIALWELNEGRKGIAWMLSGAVLRIAVRWGFSGWKPQRNTTVNKLIWFRGEGFLPRKQEITDDCKRPQSSISRFSMLVLLTCWTNALLGHLSIRAGETLLLKVQKWEASPANPIVKDNLAHWNAIFGFATVNRQSTLLPIWKNAQHGSVHDKASNAGGGSMLNMNHSCMTLTNCIKSTGCLFCSTQKQMKLVNIL